MNQRSQTQSFFVIFFTQLFQSLSLLSLRAILVLFFVQQLHWSDNQAYLLYGSYVSLLCVAPVIGGYLSDQFLGAKKAIIIGGLFSLTGYVLLTIAPEILLFDALPFIAVGTALMLPTTCSAIGLIYENDHLKHDQAYNYFYMAVNIGGIIAGIAVSIIISRFGWHPGFGVAAFSMLLSITVFVLNKNTVAQHIESKPPKSNNMPFIILGLFLSVFLIKFFLLHIALIKWLILLFSLVVVINFITIAKESTTTERKKLINLAFIFALSIFYFVMYEQSSTSITLFTDRVIDRHFLHHTIPTPLISSLNPLYVILLSPLLGILWQRLSQRRLEPSILQKISCGIIITSIGFLLLSAASLVSLHPGLLWIVAVSFLLTFGELLVGPVSIAAISALAPSRYKTTLTGGWFIIGAIASYLSALIAKLTSTSNIDVATNTHYASVFKFVGLDGLLLGLVILVFAPYIIRTNT